MNAERVRLLCTRLRAAAYDLTLAHREIIASLRELEAELLAEKHATEVIQARPPPRPKLVRRVESSLGPEPRHSSAELERGVGSSAAIPAARPVRSETASARPPELPPEPEWASGMSVFDDVLRRLGR